MAPVQIPGVILRTVGRTPCTDPLAVVLHEYDSGIESLDSQLQFCPRPRLVCPNKCHTSFHFGIGGNCDFHQYVPIADTAWGFAVTPPTCPEPICAPDPCASCTGLTDDQFNPDADGVPPTLPAFVADACGTANSCVIHVAVNSIFPTNEALGSGPCCAPNAAAYKCLVQSLCFIFNEAGLVPDLSTLLVHCNELICLDIEQLIIDINLCLNAPPPVVPPCQCAPTAAQFCDTLALLGTSEVGTELVLGPDCLFHPSADAFAVAALDTATINTTVTEAPANTFTVSGDVVVSPDTGNTIVAQANGLYSTRGPLVVAPIANAGTIDPTSGTDVYVYSGVGAGAATLVNPTGTEKNDLWVKNISASAFTITAASLIDGVGVISLDGTIPAGYPFGNNGGEAVHLVYDTANTTWYVL